MRFEYGYTNLEDPEHREIASSDPKAFLAALPDKAIIDEIHGHGGSGLRGELYFFRDSNGSEVDLLIPGGTQLKALEIKLAATFKMDRLKGLRRFRSLSQSTTSNYLIYNGTSRSLSEQTRALNFSEIHSVFVPVNSGFQVKM